MQVGEKLKQKRNEAGLSQETLSEKIGVSRQTVYNWENNRSYPDIGSVLRLSDLYGISLDELLKEDVNMRKHVEETAKLPLRWWRFLCGLTIALIPISSLLDYWGATPAAMVLKILVMIFIPVLLFARWKFTGGEKKELFIILGLYGFLLVTELVHQGDSLWTGAIGIWLVMAFVLIYGYGEYLGKGLSFWLLIFLYFGTPVYMAVDTNFPVFYALEATNKVDLYGNYQIEEVLDGTGLTGRWISISENSSELFIDGKSIGYLQYTKPLDNQPQLYAVWQLVPEDSPNTLYRLEVDIEMNRTLSCQVDGQLQWRWLLLKLPDLNMNP